VLPRYIILSRLLLRRKIGAAPSHLGMPKRTVHASNKFIHRIPNHVCSSSASGQELLHGPTHERSSAAADGVNVAMPRHGARLYCASAGKLLQGELGNGSAEV
jgi:hypothetical protein